MAAFAINLCQFFKHPEARIGVDVHGHPTQGGNLETDMLEHFTNKSTVECRGSETEVNVRVIVRNVCFVMCVCLCVCTIGRLTMMYCSQWNRKIKILGGGAQPNQFVYLPVTLT